LEIINIIMTEELNLKELFSKFVRFNVRNKTLLLTFIFFGIFTVVIFQKFKRPYYETMAICMSGISEYERQEQIEDLSQRTAIDLINHLQINIANKDFAQISEVLGVEDKVASTIKKIEAEQLYQQDMNEKFYALNKFEISLTVFDNTKIAEVQDGLVYYFENNNFVQSYHERYLTSNLNVIRDIEAEIQLLADIRAEGAKNNLDVSSVNIVNAKDGEVVSNQIVLLSKLREELKVNQDLLKPLVYVQEFADVTQKEDDILVWGLLSAFISFLIGLLVALIKEVK
tara:strand:+ start:8876 stop:9730 length:855 start_codon:yes stop_codon:yes gene_type:complete